MTLISHHHIRVQLTLNRSFTVAEVVIIAADGWLVAKMTTQTPRDPRSTVSVQYMISFIHLQMQRRLTSTAKYNVQQHKPLNVNQNNCLDQ